ncbi:hypothetical protein JK217_12370 [Gluconobacter kondonii]|mgnify:CR=1 FL=1|uniref:DUF4034 domain-containing protein n=3 Tax=Gluconobacter kondonii TaxID=941463 RepID=A0ABQ5WWW7_9PROT|nr:DUF6624 domain-containing protein [Gluconobacter kondonii]MBS1078526.1 hypothetical protein [Gluconobacter kondonii]MBS1084381.1 hypothetical protein [Gluconobacter kondonii]GLQ67079.1 hypothetical protein GCM10007870_26640 [Gluconobacter kondonii]
MAGRILSRNISLATLALLLGAAAPQPPPFLASFITKGSFVPGDYSFARGAFPGATPEQVANWDQIKPYLHACEHEAALAANASLKQIGVNAKVPEDRDYQDHLCDQVGWAASATKDFTSWDSFQSAFSKSLPYYQIYAAGLSASASAVEVHRDSDNLTDQILARIIPDQGWRYPMTGSLDALPGVDADTHKALLHRIIADMIETDWDNSHWARRVVTAHGWAALTKMGGKVPGLMWLMVQHADTDPALQVLTLRQIEPLMLAGKFSREDYALMFDRVSLATIGTQHYGSQLSCKNGHFAPYSMDVGGDDSKVLDARRATMNLLPEAKYLTYLPDHC